MATGYNIYRCVGGIANMNWVTPVGVVSGAVISKSMAGLGHLANTLYTYAIRPVYSDIESPDMTAVVEVKMDGDADWEGSRPSRVWAADVELASSANVHLTWDYRTLGASPNLFGIYYQTSPYFTYGTPTTTVAYTADKQHQTTLSLSGGLTYWIAITARTTAGLESDPYVLLPIVPASASPTTPSMTIASSFK